MKCTASCPGKDNEKTAKCLCNLGLICDMHKSKLTTQTITFRIYKYCQTTYRETTRSGIHATDVSHIVNILEGKFDPIVPMAVVQMLPNERVGLYRSICINLKKDANLICTKLRRHILLKLGISCIIFFYITLPKIHDIYSAELCIHSYA